LKNLKNNSFQVTFLYYRALITSVIVLSHYPVAILARELAPRGAIKMISAHSES